MSTCMVETINKLIRVSRQCSRSLDVNEPTPEEIAEEMDMPDGEGRVREIAADLSGAGISGSSIGERKTVIL